MTRRDLQPGDQVEARIRGERIIATVEDLDDPAIPDRPIRVRTDTRRLTRYLNPRQVVTRLARPAKQMELA